MPPGRPPASRAALAAAACLLAARTLASAPPPRALPLSRAGDSSGCCGPAGLVCGGDNFTGLVEKQLYFVHPRSAGGSFGWGNHNLADALGDAAFLCVDGSFVSRFNDSLISTVVIEGSSCSASSVATCCTCATLRDALISSRVHPLKPTLILADLMEEGTEATTRKFVVACNAVAVACDFSARQAC